MLLRSPPKNALAIYYRDTPSIFTKRPVRIPPNNLNNLSYHFTRHTIRRRWWVVMYALGVIDKVRRSLSILRNKPMDLYAALLLLKLANSLDMGVFFTKALAKL